jgi:cellulose synthase/poly-beta-1,6-N-acetylglucosamine synthase-like glycosyltransferase
MSCRPFVVVCIPAYNEEKTIAKVVLLAQKHVDKVIVCDDGSTDMTGEIASKLARATTCCGSRKRIKGPWPNMPRKRWVLSRKT